MLNPKICPEKYQLSFLEHNRFSPVIVCARESDAAEEDDNGKSSKRQKKLTSVGFTTPKKRSEDIESSGKGRCKFFQSRKLELLTQF